MAGPGARQRPPLPVGSTPIIADDRGHLLPPAPRSQLSPWGSFVGTWELPPRLPPARLDLTSRSAAAAARLLRWVRQPNAPPRSGLRTRITGKPQEPHQDTPTPEEHLGTQRGDPASPQVLPEEPPSSGAGATTPLSSASQGSS